MNNVLNSKLVINNLRKKNTPTTEIKIRTKKSNTFILIKIIDVKTTYKIITSLKSSRIMYGTMKNIEL